MLQYIIIINRISRAPIYHTRWQHRAHLVRHAAMLQYIWSATHCHVAAHLIRHTLTLMLQYIWPDTPCPVAVDLVRHTMPRCSTSGQTHTAMLRYIWSDTLPCRSTSGQTHTVMLRYILSDTHRHVAVHPFRYTESCCSTSGQTHTTIGTTSGQTHIAMLRYISSDTYYVYLIRQTLLCFRVYLIRHC